MPVRRIVVRGHYGCGEVDAALAGPLHSAIDRWLQHVRDIRSAHAIELERIGDVAARWRRLCELNAAAQVRSVSQIPAVREAWLHGREVAIHGWIYDLHDGLLRDLKVGIAGLAAA
jgi:carbonic anhydrase